MSDSYASHSAEDTSHRSDEKGIIGSAMDHIKDIGDSVMKGDKLGVQEKLKKTFEDVKEVVQLNTEYDTGR
ncbi:hypothetical protein HDE_04458 [Halotydeus destructor]|nr:hypothetical protein HDE_04458 [Halotydeus destructor]